MFQWTGRIRLFVANYSTVSGQRLKTLCFFCRVAWNGEQQLVSGSEGSGGGTGDVQL